MSRFVKGEGAFVNMEKLRKLAFTDNDKTDHERELRVALQDALTVIHLYRVGKAEEWS